MELSDPARKAALHLLTELFEISPDISFGLQALGSALQVYCLSQKISPEDHKKLMKALVDDYAASYEA